MEIVSVIAFLLLNVDASLQGCWRTGPRRCSGRRPVPCGVSPRNLGGCPRETQAGVPAKLLPGEGRIAQLNRLETDRSSLMRVIASAISGAMVSWRTLRDACTASVAWM